MRLSAGSAGNRPFVRYETREGTEIVGLSAGSAEIACSAGNRPFVSFIGFLETAAVLFTTLYCHSDHLNLSLYCDSTQQSMPGMNVTLTISVQYPCKY